MIVKGSQRGDARSLAAHLLNASENEHITVQEMRGFVAEDLPGALREGEALASGTRCRQPFFHVSLSPPAATPLTPAQYGHGIALIEGQYPKLKSQPRAVVFHIKQGRHHAHVVWSRIDTETFTAIPVPFFKLKLRSVAKELARTCGLPLPQGLENSAARDPLNYDQTAARQAKRLHTDPKALKAFLRQACEHSPTVEAFGQALAQEGFALACGDRRGFVAVHEATGEVLSLARTTGIKTKDLKAKYGDPTALPSLATIRAQQAQNRPADRETAEVPAQEEPRASGLPRRGRLSALWVKAARWWRQDRPRSRGPPVALSARPANYTDTPSGALKASVGCDLL